jgi:hypothetical protein
VSVPREIQNLTVEIMEEFPQAQIDFDPLPSGVCWLGVWLGRRNFELEYHPVRGAAVSENFDNTPPFTGHDSAFGSLAAAVTHFKSLLATAAETELSYLPQTFALHETTPIYKDKGKQ